MRKIVYLSLFLCLTLAGCGNVNEKRKQMANVNSYETNEDKSYQRAVREKKEPSNEVNPYQMTVEMRDNTDDRTPQQNIVICHGCRNKESVDSVYASYTAINCKSALWVVWKINNFINLNMSSVESTFDRELTQFDDEIWSNVDRFITILLNFLEKISNSSYYMDKTVLKAFISLKIKISLMRNRGNFVNMGFKKTEMEIIEILLVEIGELQRYSSVHCNYTTVKTSTIPDYFKMWVFVDGPTKDDMDIDAFLRITANTGLEPVSPLNNCHARQILLEGMVQICGTDAISSVVMNVTSDESGQDDDTITIRRIAGRVLVSYDVDVFFWYHDSVMAAIMKLLCHVALTNENGLSDAAMNTIKEIKKKILADKDVLPAYFTEGFDLLLRENVDTSELMSYYFKRLRGFHVKPSTGTDGVTRLADQLLELIRIHFDKIKCAEVYLKHLRGEHDKYYTPGSHNRSTLLSDYSQSDATTHVTACEFVTRLYIDAFCISNFVESAIDRNMTLFINAISDFCILVIQNERDNWHFVRTAYDVVVLLRNLRQDSRDKKEMIFLYERAMDRVLSELNVYRMKHCRNWSHEYGEYKCDYKQDRDARSLWRFMRGFFKSRYDVILPEQKASVSVDVDDRYFRVEYLYKNYVENSDVVEQYRDVVQVYWNRRLLSVDVIFAESVETTLDPRNVYALYDVYNKFFLAVIFREARRALAGSDYESLEAESAKLKTAFDFNKFHDVFPDGLAALKTDLSTIFSFPYMRIGPDGIMVSEMSANDAVRKLRNAVSDAEVKFVKSNVVIDDDAVKRPSTSNRTPLEDDDFLAVLHKDVNVLVRQFNKKFQQFRRFY